MKRKVFIFTLLFLILIAAVDCHNGKALVKVSKVAERILSSKFIKNTVKYSSKNGVLYIKLIKNAGKETGDVCTDLSKNISKTIKKNHKGKIILTIAEKLDIYKTASEFRKNGTWNLQYVKWHNIPMDKVSTQHIGKRANAKTLYINMVILGMPEDITIIEKKVYKLQSTDIRRTKTHHIISGTSKAAEKSREILKKFNIDINDGRNGILLPDNKGHFAKGSKHGTSTIDYDNAVYERIKNCTTKEDLLNELDKIKDDLYYGILPIINQHEFII